LDSLLIAAFEEEFNIQTDEQKAREVQTVGASIEFTSLQPNLLQTSMTQQDPQ
jgi:acyl carrier protein